MTADYRPLFKRWALADSAPKDGTLFMGRITGTNRAVAIKWQDDLGFVDGLDHLVSICQWISFTDFADIRACVWRTK